MIGGRIENPRFYWKTIERIRVIRHGLYGKRKAQRIGRSRG